MKTLYFDIDGTILLLDQHVPKPGLANGRFEAAIRKVGFQNVDDLAAEYLRAANQEEVLNAHHGRRVFIPSPTGNGDDVMNWLDGVV